MTCNAIIDFLKKREFGWGFLGFGLLIQIITYIISKDSLLSFVSGIAGVVSVVQCSEKRLSFYFWGFLQIITFVIIAFQENLYGKLLENAFYFFSMVVGIFIWRMNRDETITDKAIVKPRKLSSEELSLIFASISILICTSTCILASTDDNQPFLDSLTTITAIVAQFLMITGYREQWIFWAIVDIASIVLWTLVGNYCMVAQYIFWTLNCLYGFLLWKET